MIRISGMMYLNGEYCRVSRPIYIIIARPKLNITKKQKYNLQLIKI